jgi:hypothetical protein
MPADPGDRVVEQLPRVEGARRQTAQRVGYPADCSTGGAFGALSSGTTSAPHSAASAVARLVFPTALGPSTQTTGAAPRSLTAA